MSHDAAAEKHLSNSFFGASLADADPEIARAIDLELGRQRDEIELIASENIVSRAVLEAQGSVMTKAIRAGAITAAASSSTSPKSWRSSAPAGSSAAASPMSSPTPAARPTRPCSWR